MPIRSDEYNGVSVLTIEGDLAGDAVLDAQRLLHGPVMRNLVFDLNDCGFIDSAGLELLSRTRRRCDEAGCRIELARVGPNCRKILELTRLAGRFDCHVDLARALAAAR
jgi:anti-anti-sigma factor